MIPLPPDPLPLLRFLDEFRDAMLQKFIDRHERAIRRFGSSVVDPNFDWENGLSLEHIEAHAREEIAEWLQASPSERPEEDVDIANMAFLDWVFRRKGRGKE